MLMTVVTSIWVVLFLGVATLAGVRKWVAREEDDTLHLGQPDGSVMKRQNTLAGTLERVDKWGKLLTVVMVIYGLALLGRIVYQAWLESGMIKN
jgi:hypothetical protein